METVRFNHYRDTNPRFAPYMLALELEGVKVPNKCQVVTECVVTNDFDGEAEPVTLIGRAYCSRKDQFNKAFGRQIAEGRVVKLAHKRKATQLLDKFDA